MYIYTIYIYIGREVQDGGELEQLGALFTCREKYRSGHAVGDIIYIYMCIYIHTYIHIYIYIYIYIYQDGGEGEELGALLT